MNRSNTVNCNWIKILPLWCERHKNVLKSSLLLVDLQATESWGVCSLSHTGSLFLLFSNSLTNLLSCKGCVLLNETLCFTFRSKPDRSNLTNPSVSTFFSLHICSTFFLLLWLNSLSPALSVCLSGLLSRTLSTYPAAALFEQWRICRCCVGMLPVPADKTLGFSYPCTYPKVSNVSYTDAITEAS